MGLRFPKANTWFQNYTDTDLAPAAQAIHDGLVASSGTFTTPPVAVATLQTLIDNYVGALSLATGPGAGIINTANKNAAKLVLVNALRRNCAYVNMTIVGLIASGTTYDAAKTFIIDSGYQLSKDPEPAGPLGPVSVRKYGSYTKKQFYILVEKITNAKGYVVRIINITTGESFEMPFPSTRMTINNLVSGNEYTFQIAAIGANPTRDFSTQITNQFIL